MKNFPWLRLTALLTLAVLATSLTASCGEKEPAGPKGAVPIADPIKITTGLISGTLAVSEPGKEVRIYKGIPYAAPPVGDLRWKPPQPVAPWEGVRECTQWGNRCAQLGTFGEGNPSEDCLYLNVITPAKTTADKLPVMVFFHGGGLTIGSGNGPLYNHHALPQHGVVLVTVNHRLGAIGFLAHPALSAESEHNASGNYGILDLVAALQWVHDNIAAFGGDPDNVTIFGESGGGGKVLACMSSPLTRGLFHRAIIESGSAYAAPTGSATREQAEKMGANLVAKLGISGTPAEILTTLRSKSWQEIAQVSGATDSGYSTMLTADGWVLPDTVYNIFQQGKQHDVPLIVGAQEGEITELSASIPRVAGLMSTTASSKVYAYMFSHVPSRWKEDGVIAFHGLELPYVFGLLEATSTLAFLGRGSGIKQPDPGLDEKDKVVAENMMKVWVQFARTGNPSIPGVIDWTPYDPTTEPYLDIGYELKVKTGLSKAGVRPAVSQQPAGTATYTNKEFGFSLQYPDNWTEKTEDLGPSVIWRVGAGTYYVPSVRVIVRDQSEGSDLKEVFTRHLIADGNKTIDTFTASKVTVNGTELTRAEVTYTGAAGKYDSLLAGLVKNGKWVIIEVYTVPSYFPFSTPTQKADIIGTVKFK